MRFEKPLAVSTIADFIGARIGGNRDSMITGINEIHKVEEGDLVFVDHPKYYSAALKSKATFIIINKDMPVPDGKTLLIVDEPFEAYNKIARHYHPFVPQQKLIAGSAIIGEGTVIMPGCYIGENVSIGKECIIHPHVTILGDCIIGDNVMIQAGTVIGSDAFYYNKKPGRDIAYKKMESCGRVVIENWVEIGANCCIDRGVSHDTRIGAGTKFDNQIHIAHDTVIGRNCLFAAQVVVGGCVTISDNVTIWGGVVVNKSVLIGENAIVLGAAAVAFDLEGNKTYWGIPAREASTVKRELVWIKRIPELWEKMTEKNIVPGPRE